MSKAQKNEFTISGKVVFISPIINITDKMSKQFLIIEVFADKKYRQEISLDFINNNIKLLNGVYENDEVTVQFQLRGKKVMKEGKAIWFNTLNAYSLEKN